MLSCIYAPEDTTSCTPFSYLFVLSCYACLFRCTVAKNIYHILYIVWSTSVILMLMFHCYQGLGYSYWIKFPEEIFPPMYTLPVSNYDARFFCWPLLVVDVESSTSLSQSFLMSLWEWGRSRLRGSRSYGAASDPYNCSMNAIRALLCPVLRNTWPPAVLESSGRTVSGGWMIGCTMPCEILVC